MTRARRKPTSTLALVLGAVWCLFSIRVAAESDGCGAWVARAASVEGNVELRRARSAQWTVVHPEETFCEGDALRVRHNSRAALILNNDTIVRLDQNTTVTFTGLAPQQPAWLDLVEGIAHFISRVRQSFRVVTPFVNAAVEGTEFVVAVSDDESRVTVFEGQVLAENDRGALRLGSGQSAVASASQGPVLSALVKPRSAVQWALYYPPVIELSDADLDSVPEQWRPAIEQSLAAYSAGDPTAALAPVEQLQVRQPGLAAFYAYRASLYLSVGRVERALQDLDTARSLNVDFSDVLALQSIIAVVQNDVPRALQLAHQALAATPQAAAAPLALSYAQQARFDEKGALATVRSAVERYPDNALLWARLAELYLGSADLKAALEAAQRAARIEPGLARIQSVLGFADLAQINLARAERAFQRAIELGQSDPLPRLGLGLVTIRRGRLDKGRRQIELAASLDPNNSLIRSYLGKAYFDEKRDRVAGTELAMAKQLDPNDPTPWFYDAIRKQTENRPVEALQDLQKSIELNDNRAVYRSEFLLDQDLAARSAGLARIYGDLGFDQLALVEGWKSVNTDPGNYSAHRLLADSYAYLPQHQIARTSELLQSQLLQPLNLTPLQPELAESNLLLCEGLGPSDPSLLEFNPLFTRNRLALQGSGVFGGNDTLGDNLIQSGLHNNWSYSVGQYHYETDGFRDNNDQNQNIYNLFVQNALSYRTSVQGEIRISDINQGDVPLGFDSGNFSETLRSDIEVKTYRLGLNHAFTPRSRVLGSVIYSDRQTHSSQADPVNATTNGDRDSYLIELQHLMKMGRFHLTSGAGRFHGDNDSRLAIDLGPLLPAPLVFRNQEDPEHGNLYAYSQTQFASNFNLILAASYEDYTESDFGQHRDQWNPKIGALWDITPATTLRAAAFRVLRRPTDLNPTIEPTQVAGFNQFFDDPPASDSRRYGIALDHRFSRRVYGGLEYSKRDIHAPYTLISPQGQQRENADSDEYLTRAYAYWTPTQSLAISAEYDYEDIRRDDDYPPDVLADSNYSKLQTQRMPLGVSLYLPSGWFAGLKATYVDQEGTFVQPQGDTVDGQDDFWVVDTAVGYRLPKRYGILSVGVKNLFDQSFNYQDRAAESPTFYPERLVFGRVTLSF